MAKKRRRRRNLGHVTKTMTEQMEETMGATVKAMDSASSKGAKSTAHNYLERLAGMDIMARDLGLKCLCPTMGVGEVRTRQKQCFCASNLAEAGGKYLRYKARYTRL